MERFTDVLPVRLVDSKAAADPLRLAVAAYLARLTGSSRDHAYSDLRCFLAWCAERSLDPLAASRAQLERTLPARAAAATSTARAGPRPSAPICSAAPSAN